MEKVDQILCLSGGMDSVIAWYYLDKPPCIYFDTGVPYAQKEKEAIRKLGIPCRIDTSLNFRMERNDFIPHRNLLFAARASVYSDIVIMAGLKDDVVVDKTPEAFNAMGECLTNIGKNTVKVVSPFWNMNKLDICKWFVDNVPQAEAILHQSISCYKGGENNGCYECPSCFRKACAMHSNGMYYPFHNYEIAQYYFTRAVVGTYYTPERNESIKDFVLWRGILNG